MLTENSMTISFDYTVFITSENTLSVTGPNLTHGMINESDETGAKAVRNFESAFAFLRNFTLFHFFTVS